MKRASRSVAVRYAKALYQSIQGAEGLARVTDELNLLAQVWETLPDVAVRLGHPSVDAGVRRQFMVSVTEQLKFHPHLSRVLVMLAERNRIEILSALAEAFVQQVSQASGILNGELISAAPVGSDVIASVQKELKRITGREVHLAPRQDASLLGGMVAKVDGWIWDGSLSSQLTRVFENQNSQ